jgi:DNA-binding NarL/FixJ family response regulator
MCGSPDRYVYFPCPQVREERIRKMFILVSGYILKGDNPEEMRYAINTVLRGGVYVPPSLSKHLLDPDRKSTNLLSVLTPKERSVMSLIAQGYPMKLVAHHMGISLKTAETHRNNFGRKLGHPNKAQIFAFALEHRMIDAEALAICA